MPTQPTTTSRANEAWLLARAINEDKEKASTGRDIDAFLADVRAA